MINNDYIAVLMADRCTKAEAVNLLKKGTTVYDSPEEYISSLADAYNGETVESLRASLYSPAVTCVVYAGNEYVIEYCN